MRQWIDFQIELVPPLRVVGFVFRLTWHFAKWFGTFRREGDDVQVVVPFTNIMGLGAGKKLILQD